MTDGSAGANPLDRMFDALKHPSRRRILLLVSEHESRDGDGVAVTDLATEGALEPLATELYHAHLPKLAEAGYIEWNGGTQTIRQGPDYEEIEPLLRLMSEHRNELPTDWP
jgi:DNA-binding transcriptional ArsR family regulator